MRAARPAPFIILREYSLNIRMSGQQVLLTFKPLVRSKSAGWLARTLNCEQQRPAGNLRHVHGLRMYRNALQLDNFGTFTRFLRDVITAILPPSTLSDAMWLTTSPFLPGGQE